MTEYEKLITMTNWEKNKKTQEEIILELKEELEYRMSGAAGYNSWSEKFGIIIVQAIELLKKDSEILARIKRAREEIANKYDDLANAWCEREEGRNEAILEVLDILDKLIEESEGINESTNIQTNRKKSKK